MITNEQIIEAVHRIESTDMGKRDICILRQALTDGLIRLSGGDRSVVIGGSVTNSIVVTGDNVSISVEIPADVLKMLQIPMHLPSRVKFFKGRKSILSDLIEALEPGHSITLIGPGGIGKSALAAEALWRLDEENILFERFPDGVLSYNFYKQSNVEFALEHFARILGESLSPSPIAAAERALAGKKALLFLDGTEVTDNLEQIIRIGGTCGFLITSRRRKDIYEKAIQIPILPKDHSIPLLKSWASDRFIEPKVADDICDLVGHLPLAIKIAGTYLMRTGMNPKEFKNWLISSPLGALDQGERQSQSVDILLENSLLQVSETAKMALGVVGNLALAPFSSVMIGAALEVDPISAQKALGELVDYSILSFHREHYEASHRLIREYARLVLFVQKSTLQKLLNYYENYVEDHSSERVFSTSDTERPHILALLQRKKDMEVTEVSRVLNDYAWRYFNYISYTSYNWLIEMINNQNIIRDNSDIIPNQLQELLISIAFESPKIRSIFNLKYRKIKIVFAPDFSEIYGDLNPLTTNPNRVIENTDIRTWYGSRVLFQSNEQCVLIPPYEVEFNFYAKKLRSEVINPDRGLYRDLDLSELRERLKESDLAVILDDLMEDIKKSVENKYTDFNYLIKKYRKELGVIYDFLMPSDIYRRLREIFDSGRIQRLSSLIPSLTPLVVETLKDKAIDWSSKLYKLRFPKSDITIHSEITSHIDGWAIAFLIEANKIATGRYHDYPIMIFVTRSRRIKMIAEQDFLVEVPGVGPFQTLWSPETFLAFYLVQEACGNDMQMMNVILDNVDSLVRNWIKD